MIGKYKTVGGLLILVFLAASWSLLRPEFFRPHDYVHGARVVEMLRALQDGQLPARWSANFGYGYGMPLFSFYAPFAYYLGAFLYWAGLSLLESVRWIFILSTVMTLAGSYWLGVTVGKNKWAGVITAALITLAPYRAVNMFVRGALGETWGLVWIPWLIAAGLQLLDPEVPKSRKPVLWLLAIGSAVGLFLSHNLTTLMAIPIIGLIWLLWESLAVVTRQKSNKDVLATGIPLITAMVLSVAIAAFYLFPSFLEKGATQISSILGGYFHHSYHFLYIRQFFQVNWKYGGSIWGPEDDISFFLGYPQLVGLGIAGCIAAYSLWKYLWGKQDVDLKVIAQQTGLGLIAGLCLYLTLLKSMWLWDSLPLIAYIQFPWRWLTLVVVLLSMIIALSVRALSPYWQKWYVLVLVSLAFLHASFFKPEKYLSAADAIDSFYYSDPVKIRNVMSEILPDYIPHNLYIGAAVDATASQKPTLLPNETGGVLYQPDTYASTDYSVLVDRSHQKLISTRFSQATQLTFAVANFPGWQAELDGKPVAIQETDHGLVAVMVPAGEHKLGILLTRTPVRTISEVLSVVGLVLVIAGAYAGYPRIKESAQRT